MCHDTDDDVVDDYNTHGVEFVGRSGNNCYIDKETTRNNTILVFWKPKLIDRFINLWSAKN